jgi:hypothetical protein
MKNIVEVFIGMVSIIFDRMNVILPFFSDLGFMLGAGSRIVFVVKRRGKPACLPSDSKCCRYRQTNKIFLYEQRHKLQTCPQKRACISNSQFAIRNSQFVIRNS